MRRALRCNGVRLAVVEQGHGPAAVLCHGGPGMWDYLGPVARMIDDRFTVVRYDQRGCGASEDRPPYDLPTLVEDLEALRRALGVRRWVVGGHSFGAGLALAYAAAHPERVRALLYLCGTGLDLDWQGAYARERERRRAAAGLADDPDGSLAADFADPARGLTLVRSLQRRDASTSWAVNRRVWQSWEGALPDLRSRVEVVRCPTLVVHGSEDPRPIAPARRLCELLPDARLVEVEGVGHWPWLEAPDRVRALLRGFLDPLVAPNGNRAQGRRLR